MTHFTDVNTTFKTSLTDISHVLFSLFIKTAEEVPTGVFSTINNILLQNNLAMFHYFSAWLCLTYVFFTLCTVCLIYQIILSNSLRKLISHKHIYLVLFR